MQLLASALLATAALRPPTRSAPPLMAVGGGLTRRAALLSLPLALAAASPQRAAAICSCPTGFDSCVCTDDDPSVSTTTIQKKRADAAGREAEYSRALINSYRDQEALTSDERATTQARDRAKSSQGAKDGGGRAQVSAGASDGPTRLERGSLTGFGTQTYSDVDVEAARRRFAEIVMDAVAKREADYGFKLDAEDIKQVESVLRIKYCGKEGMIGPC